MKTNKHRVWFIGVMAIGIGVFAPGTAQAQVTNAWTALGNGKWEIGANWSFSVPSKGVPFQQVRPVAGVPTVITVDQTTVASNEFNGCMTISNLLVTGTTGVNGHNTSLVISDTDNGLDGFNIFTVLNDATITSRGSVTITNSTMVVGNPGGTLSIDGSLLLNTGSLITTNQSFGFPGVDDTVIVGNTGAGQMTVMNGTWLALYAIVGNAPGSHGTLTFAGGTISLLQDDALDIGEQAGAVGTVWMTGGQLTSSPVSGVRIGVGGDGQMTVSNGVLAPDAFDDFDIIYVGAAGGRGTLTFAGGSTSNSIFSVGGDSLVLAGPAGNGTVWLTGGQLSAAVGVGVIGVGQMTMSNGVWHADSDFSFDNSVGEDGGSGTLTVAGGQMIMTNMALQVGSSGVGEFKFLGGTDLVHEVDLGMGINPSVRSFGNMTVLGGVLAIGTLNVGYFDSTGSGQGELTMDGGSVTVLSNLEVGACVTNAFGLVTMNGGTLFVTNATHNAVLEVGEGSFFLNGGTLVVDKLVVTSSCAGIFDHTGGTLVYGQLVLDPNGDADGDGLPNSWEQLYGLDPLSSSGNDGPDGDPDADGYSNLEEYLAGSDPLNPLSTPVHPVAPPFQITSIVQSGKDIILSWNTAGGLTNQMQVTSGWTGGIYSTNGFANLGAQMIIPGSGITTTNYTDLGGATNKPARYYRVRLVP